MERLRKQLRDLEAEKPDEDEIFYKIYELYDKEWEPLNQSVGCCFESCNR
jgi:hypothetical protein